MGRLVRKCLIDHPFHVSSRAQLSVAKVAAEGPKDLQSGLQLLNLEDTTADPSLIRFGGFVRDDSVPGGEKGARYFTASVVILRSRALFSVSS